MKVYNFREIQHIGDPQNHPVKFEQYILKSDHDKAMSAKDLEIKMLREQRNFYIEEAFSEDDDTFIKDEADHMDNKITSALEKMEK